MTVGWSLQVAALTARGIAIGGLPWGNMFEFASVVGIVAVGLSLLLLVRKNRLRFLIGFVLLPVVLFLVLAGLRLYAEAAPIVAALRSYWLAIHVTAASVASGSFLVSAVASGLYLLRVRHDRLEAATGRPKPSRVAGRLPTAAELDRLAARTITFGFPVWTFALITGAVWAEAAWGRYWGWDPKETWAFISWVVYAAYLHARATAGWTGARAAAMNILGAATMVFNFVVVVVNVFVPGLHSYAGLG